MWRGDNISYSTMHHDRLPAQRGRARDYSCKFCGGPAREWAFDRDTPESRTKVSPTGQPFSPDTNAYVAACKSCHTKYDRYGYFRGVADEIG
jgi:hypothetical protein